MDDLSSLLAVSMVVVWILVIFHSAVLLGVVNLTSQLYKEVRSLELSPTEVVRNDPVSERPLPPIDTVDLLGRPFSSENFEARTAALLFVSPGCPSCVAALHELRTIGQHANPDNVFVFCHGDSAECCDLGSALELRFPIIPDPKGEIRDKFGVRSSPTILIAENGRVRFHGYDVRTPELEALLKDGRGDLKSNELHPPQPGNIGMEPTLST